MTSSSQDVSTGTILTSDTDVLGAGSHVGLFRFCALVCFPLSASALASLGHELLAFAGLCAVVPYHLPHTITRAKTRGPNLPQTPLPTDDLDAPLVRPVVRPRALERGQEAVVDVDGALPVALAELVREHLHVARQDDHVDVVLLQQRLQLRLLRVLVALVQRQVYKGHAERVGHGLEVGVVGYDERDVAAQLAGAVADEQVVQAVVLGEGKERVGSRVRRQGVTGTLVPARGVVSGGRQERGEGKRGGARPERVVGRLCGSGWTGIMFDEQIVQAVVVGVGRRGEHGSTGGGRTVGGKGEGQAQCGCRVRSAELPYRQRV